MLPAPRQVPTTRLDRRRPPVQSLLGRRWGSDQGVFAFMDGRVRRWRVATDVPPELSRREGQGEERALRGSAAAASAAAAA